MIVELAPSEVFPYELCNSSCASQITFPYFRRSEIPPIRCRWLGTTHESPASYVRCPPVFVKRDGLQRNVGILQPYLALTGLLFLFLLLALDDVPKRYEATSNLSEIAAGLKAGSIFSNVLNRHGGHDKFWDTRNLLEKSNHQLAPR